MEDDDFLPSGAREGAEPAGEIDFLGGVEGLVESSDSSKGFRADEDESAGQPFAAAAGQVPGGDGETSEPVGGVHAQGGAAGQNAGVAHLPGHVFEQRRARVAVGVEEEDPVACGEPCTAVSGASDLADGLEDHRGACSSGDAGGGVGGMVVADDAFDLPGALGQGAGSLPDGLQGAAQPLFFVVRGDDDGDPHRYSM